MSRRGYSLYRKAGKGPWYVSWTDGEGNRLAIRGSVDKSIASEIGRAKAAEADRVRCGVVDPKQQVAKNAGQVSISVHLDEWKGSMASRGRTPRYVAMQRSRVVRLFDLCGISCLNDMTRDRVESGLGKITNLHTAQTANHYRTAVKIFSRWCRKSSLTVSNNLEDVGVVSAPGRTFRRTAINADQLSAILESTESRNCKSAMKNIDRAMYYRIMAYTGFRKGEAASLTPESFNLASDAPTITVEASYSKRRRRDVQQIPVGMVPHLSEWLKGKTPLEPVFKIDPWMNLNKVFRLDCKAAGVVPGDKERLGVHSLRRFYITSVIRSGGLAVAQRMARHSTPGLTAQYADLDDQDILKGLSGLPPVR